MPKCDFNKFAKQFSKSSMKKAVFLNTYISISPSLTLIGVGFLEVRFHIEGGRGGGG